MAHRGKFVAVVVLLLASCTGGSDDSGGNADAGPPDSGDELLLTCNADSSDFPPFSRSCEDAADCAIANHQIDCCGSTIATGIAESSLASFEVSEQACGQLFPDCGCASQPPILDDTTMALGLESIGVRCTDEGACVTFNLGTGGG